MKKLVSIIKGIYFSLKNLLSLPLNTLRKNKIHSTARISTNVLMVGTKIGRGSYIAKNTIFNFVTIGNYCSIAPGVQIGGMQHSYWWYSTSYRLSTQCIRGNTTEIGHDVWIGSGSIIKQGVKIGSGSVIGAMSFVNKDVPENSIFFGSPAKFYKKRMEDTEFEKWKKSEYWLHNEKKAKEILKTLDNS